MVKKATTRTSHYKQMKPVRSGRGRPHRRRDGKHGFSGNGGPATPARLYGPQGVTVNGAGNLVIADAGSSRLRMISG
jgi:NHL repeat